jgi:transcription elongation factor Elf1
MRRSDFVLNYLPDALLPDRPSCPRCGTRMWIVRVTTIDKYTSERTFGCPACDKTETLVRSTPHSVVGP